jgi:hypothetical protein
MFIRAKHGIILNYERFRQFLYTVQPTVAVVYAEL